MNTPTQLQDRVVELEARLNEARGQLVRLEALVLSQHFPERRPEIMAALQRHLAEFLARRPASLYGWKLPL